jgi:DNA polymerase I
VYGGVEYRDYPDPDNVHKLDTNILPIVHSMENVGIRVDLPLLQSVANDIRVRQVEIVSTIPSVIGDYQYTKIQRKKTKAGTTFITVREPFNINSPDMVAQLLFHELKVQGNTPVELTASRKRESTADDILDPFMKSHPIVPLIAEYRELEKIAGTYAEPLQLMADSDSRIHTRFNPTVASTGRLASSSPNLMNIPVRSKIGKRIRDAFIARPGCVLLSNDLSQIEMRWAAHGSGDENMIMVFWEGRDIHTQTACRVFDRDYSYVVAQETLDPAWYKNWKATERAPSKNLGFGVLYGLTPPGLKRNIFNESGGKVDWTEEKCATFIEKFFTVYPGLNGFIDLQHRRCMRYGMCWDAFGRPRLVPEGKSCHKRIKNEGLRKAGNHYEQSSAQGTIKLAMAELIPIYVDMNSSFTCVPLLQVHDELISEVDKYYARDVAYEISKVMSNASPLDVPVESSSDFGERWGDLK